MNTPLSAEEMLHHLHMQAFAARTVMGTHKLAADDWLTANRRLWPEAEAMMRAKHQEATAELCARELQAIEQAIALLEVLTHPAFEGISHHWKDLKPQFFNVVFLGSIGDYFVAGNATTLLEALLAAHKALKELAKTND